MKRPKQGNIRYFEKIDTRLKAYFLGFIVADGCVQNFTSSSVGLSITLGIKDRIILDKLKEEIGNEHEIRVFTRPQTFNKEVRTTFCRFQIANKLLVDDLLKHGVTPRKSLTVPDIIQSIPSELRNSFILGYFDGDGSVILPKGKTKFSKTRNEFYQCKSKQVVVNIRGTEDFLTGLVRELNLETYQLVKYDSTFRLVIGKKIETRKFFSIYRDQPFYLDRKYEKFLTRIHEN